MFENHNFISSNCFLQSLTLCQHRIINLSAPLCSRYFSWHCSVVFADAVESLFSFSFSTRMEVVSPTWWTRQIPNFTFCHRSAINLPPSLLWFTSSPAAALSSTWLCHKVRAKPAVAGRHRFTRVGSTDRATFTAPDLCQAHSVAAFLRPLILKGLHCSSQLFWPSPVKVVLRSPGTHIFP